MATALLSTEDPAHKGLLQKFTPLQAPVDVESRVERCLARFMPDMVQSVLSVLEQRQAQPAGSCAQTHARSCRQEFELQQRSNPVQALLDQVSIHCYKELLSFICTDEFKNEYGEVYIIPKRLNQDIVEFFFSVQRQLCGGNRNMTAYTYGYNLSGIMSFKSSNLVSRSQTNVNSITDVAGDLDALAADSLPRQSDNSSICKLVPWVANLPQL